MINTEIIRDLRFLDQADNKKMKLLSQQFGILH